MAASGDDFGTAAGGHSSRPRRARPEPTPAQRALGLLVRREHSRKELVQKLALRGVEDDAAREAVDRMAEAGWQDDARFAELLVRSRASAGQGPLRIRAELRTHGLGEDMVRAALATFDGNWVDLARELARRRFPAALDGEPAMARKAAEFLWRRGFSVDQVRGALSGLPDED